MHEPWRVLVELPEGAKGISLETIARMNRDYLEASLADRGETSSGGGNG